MNRTHGIRIRVAKYTHTTLSWDEDLLITPIRSWPQNQKGRKGYSKEVRSTYGLQFMDSG